MSDYPISTRNRSYELPVQGTNPFQQDRYDIAQEIGFREHITPLARYDHWHILPLE
jgi:hypothetical protein